MHRGDNADLLLTLSLPTTPESGLTGQIEAACRGLDSLLTSASPTYSEVTPTPVKDLLRACRSRSPPVFPWMQSNPMFEEVISQVKALKVYPASLTVLNRGTFFCVLRSS